MEKTIVAAVLWTWLVGCILWVWSLNRLAHWESRWKRQVPARQVKRAWRRQSGVLLLALVVIGLNWLELPSQSWLLPIAALDEPLLNRSGLLLIRVSLLWVVVMTVQGERQYRSGWREPGLIPEVWQSWAPFYAGQLALGGSGLLLGLFLSLSSLVTAGLCGLGGWFGWQFWRAYTLVFNDSMAGAAGTH